MSVGVVARSRLTRSVWIARQEAWETNGVLVAAEEHIIVTGPGFPEADEAARHERFERDLPVHLVLSHIDFDHLRAAGEHPRATAHASHLTAAGVADEELMTRYERMASEWGSPWQTRPWVDRPFEPGELLFPTTAAIQTIGAAGHTRDSVALYFERDGVLLPGDYVSTTTYPLISASMEEAVATHHELLELLASGAVWLVVPGHGPVLDAVAAVAVARADLDYLEAVRDAVASAVARGQSDEDVLTDVRGRAHPPRAARAGFETIDTHAINIKRACADARKGS